MRHVSKLIIAALLFPSLSFAQGIMPSGGIGTTSVVVNTTTITGGVTNQLLFDNVGTIGEVTKGNSCVYLTSGAGAPSCSTTLPSGLTIPGFAPLASPTFTGTVTLPDASTFGTNFAIGGTGILTSPGVALLQHGAADAAAPVAQTIKVQSVVAGTSNTAGVETIFVASLGTGTGASGLISFKGNLSGSTGTTQNAAQYFLSISSSGPKLQFYDGASSTIQGSISGGDTGSALTFFGGTNRSLQLDTTSLKIISTSSFAWAPSTDTRTTADTFLTRPAAASIQHGAADAAAPVAQTIKVQSVVAGNANTAGANATIIGSLSNGSGLGGLFNFNISNSNASSGVQNTATTRFTIGPSGAKFPIVAVASLPTCDATNEGSNYGVNNALAPAFLAAVVGGGTVHTSVYCDGTNWVSN